MLGIRFSIVRRFFRRIMKPMTVQEAEAKRLFFAKGYFFFSALALGTVFYQIGQGKLEWLDAEGLVPEDEQKLSPGFRYARMLGVEQATVVRVKGLEILNKKEYQKDTFDIKQHIEEEEANLNSEGVEKTFLKIKG
ncbi:uncharacterized protein LOC126833549 [Adelges cooleyi]|uniref:uncharacterized protein LOC126833549 n=1 Tax=Adelges cooleyi TaxID=133065 RepID=UPI00218015C2|nr:uncharacterized protein LOC126833549 [Adelges cooleyi]